MSLVIKSPLCPEFVTQDLPTSIVGYKSEIVGSEQKYFFIFKITEIGNGAKIYGECPELQTQDSDTFIILRY